MIAPGFYRHLDGHWVKVLGVARDANNQLQAVCHTKAQLEERAVDYLLIPAHEFQQWVRAHSGKVDNGPDDGSGYLKPCYTPIHPAGNTTMDSMREVLACMEEHRVAWADRDMIKDPPLTPEEQMQRMEEIAQIEGILV